MKKIISGLLILLFLLFSYPSATFAAQDQSTPEISVAITDPVVIEGKPVYNTDIQITIHNLTDHEIDGLVCYLMIVDVNREQTYPVDEFGPQAYQTRTIESLPAYSEYTVTIPVKIMYVGLFKFSASVMNMDKNYVVTADPLTVHMIATSKLNKALVIAVAAVVPLITAGFIFTLYRRRKHIETK